MLASPLLPAPIFSSQPHDDSSHYRPSKDVETFNSLLPPPIEFIEGSSSGALAVPEGRYEPINVPSKVPSNAHYQPQKVAISTSVTNSSTPAPVSPKVASLYPSGIDTTWPESCNRATGLYNSGNTCFLNSALQCLLHTPPLLRVLAGHRKETCRNDSRAFCMTCALHTVAAQVHSSRGTYMPTIIINKLQTIAKHMRRGRQEDSHEFLRYAIDALQKSCLAGYSPKIDPKLAETTWVHKIFGGRLRSRVTCRDCGHNSDTFDRILDLSLDIFKTETLKDALRKFVAVDYLKGADKYKCEKCKKPVVAEKRFTIQEAPIVLTVHLKRFSPLGRKIGHHVDYEDMLSLKPYMSEGQFGPTYSLYGVICHAGGGPNSGHYYAFVKSKDGRWWEMNDDAVTPVSGPPTNKKNAYILFYMRTKGQALEGAVNISSAKPKAGLAAGMKKRKDRESDKEEGEDLGEKVIPSFIGPLLPSPTITEGLLDTKRQKLSATDPQAAVIRAKIESKTHPARGGIESLTAYESESEDEKKSNDDEGERSSKETATTMTAMEESEVSLNILPTPLKPPASALSIGPIPASRFYANLNQVKRKRHSGEGHKNHLATDSKKRSSALLRDELDPFKRMQRKKSAHRKPMGI